MATAALKAAEKKLRAHGLAKPEAYEEFPWGDRCDAEHHRGARGHRVTSRYEELVIVRYLCLVGADARFEQDFGRAQATDAPMGRVQAFRGLSRSRTSYGVTGAPCGRGFRCTVDRC